MVSINDLLGSYSYKGQNLGELPSTLEFGDSFRRTKAPYMMANFARWAGSPTGPLAAMTRGAFQQQAEGLGAAELSARRDSANQAQRMGVSPTQFRGAESERQQGFLGQLAGARAGSEAAFNEGLLSLGQSTVNSIREAYDAQRMINFQNYWNHQQMQAANKASRLGLIGQLLGATATLGASALMGPAAGAMTAGVAGAGAAGGGGGASMNSMYGMTTPLMSQLWGIGQGNGAGNFQGPTGTPPWGGGAPAWMWPQQFDTSGWQNAISW